ncbi:hypothetical protein Gogos_011935 [Gossypium gossypioides]|uniref:DUF4283 domain-containing protein n=1 Tax=Gossypium gossypioides TaxID=34282 RepID=A0A7J9BQY8_GOSGO|nr:hypothetical protein [Gossypium gossypioides]
MELDLANLNLDDLEDNLVVGQEEIHEKDEDFRLCLVGKVLADSSIHFPSLRNVLSELWHPIEGDTITEIRQNEFYFYSTMKVAPRRELITVSKWHREEPKEVIKNDMDLEEICRRNQMRSQGEEEFNNVRGRGVEKELSRRCYRFNKVNELANRRCENEATHNMIIEANEVLKKTPTGPVDGKKRQRIQQIEGAHQNARSSSSINNEISTDTNKQADRSQ